MIITCPACSTRYTIDTVHMGTVGRLVRCSACGEQWHAHPESTGSLEDRLARSRPAATLAAQPFETEPPLPPPPPPPPPPRPPKPPAMQPTVEPPPPPTYEDEEEQVEEPPKAVPPPSTPLSDDELNAMFAEPEPVESLVDEEEDKEEDEDEPEPENYPDPDPIPQVFTDPSSVLEDEERPVSVLLVVLAALLVIAGLLGGLYFARDGVMKIVPATRAVYDLIGLAGERLGVGLEIRNIDFERETENNIDVLVVRGSIVNTDKQLRPIPYIRVVLYDAGANALQDMVMPPLESELMPGKDVGFRARFVDPSPLARRVEVTFAEPPAKPAP